MVRFKTDIEKAETPQQQADRLRGALFAASLAADFEEAKRICLCAMRGELHGHEPPPVKEPESLRTAQ